MKQYTIDQLYDLLHEKVNAIRDIFNGFFGEDNVDLQDIGDPNDIKQDIRQWLQGRGRETEDGTAYLLEQHHLDEIVSSLSYKRANIYVWWSQVRVTNENDKYVDIQDLYAKVTIAMDGRIPYEYYGFRLNRATYTEEQFLSGYMHSHVKNIPKDDFTVFQSPCLGSGPINHTIATLKNESNEVTWMLFCQELGMYVTVESLHGIPYNRLENIRISTRESSEYYNYSSAGSNYLFLELFSKDRLRKFIAYYITHGHLSIGFRDGEFKHCMPYHEFIIDISNCFIDFYNENFRDASRSVNALFTKRLLREVIISEGKFYVKGDGNSFSRQSLQRYEGKPVLTFKGRQVRTHIVISKRDTEKEQVTTLINQSFAMYVLHGILRTINYRYRNGKNNNNRQPSTAGERCIHI